MGKQFLDGYIALSEGEKDPRNLMVAFAIARVIVIEFDITLHIEVREGVYFVLLIFKIFLSISQYSTYCSVTFRLPSAPHPTIGMVSAPKT